MAPLCGQGSITRQEQMADSSVALDIRANFPLSKSLEIIFPSVFEFSELLDILKTSK
jgi:hypothetical protein